MTGRGTGWGWKVLAWRGGRSVLFSLLLGQLHPPWRPSPSTCAKECAWERRPERRAGGQQSCGHPEAAHRSEAEGPGLRWGRDPKCPPGAQV